MTNQEIEEFMRLWYRLVRKKPEKGESMSLLLQSFVNALSFQLREPIREEECYAVAYVEHGGLQIYKNDKALLFCIHCESDEDALDLYSSVKSVVYGRELTGQPVALLTLKSNPAFDAYCDESPVEFVRFPPNRAAGVLRDSKTRTAFSRMLRELADADVINPYSTAGPRETITRKDLLDSIFRTVTGGGYFSLMGPRGRGTSTMLKRLYRKLIGKPERDYFLPVFIDLFSLKPSHEKAHLVDVFNEIVRVSHVGEASTGEMDADQFSARLNRMIQQCPRRLILLIDHIDVVPDDIARNLLFALRPLRGDRLGVVAAGARDLMHLTTGQLSPFNVAETHLLKPLPLDEALSLIDVIAEENELYFTQSEAETIFPLVSGEPCLIKRLIRTHANLELRQLGEDQLSILEHSFPTVIKTWRKDEVLNDVIREIESNWDWLKLVADLLAGCRPTPFEGVKGEFQSPDMCLALERSNGGYIFASPFFEILLKEHFTPLRLADTMVINNRWEEAQKWYERAERPRGKFYPDAYTMDELVLNAFQSIERTLTRFEEVQEGTVEIAYHILGVSSVEFLSKGEEAQWTSVEKRCSGDSMGFFWKDYDHIIELASSQRRQMTAEGGRIVITPAPLRGGVQWALCSRSLQYPQSRIQRKAQETLMQYYANLVLELAKTYEIERQVEGQRRQLELVSEINTTILQSLDVKPTAQRILGALERIGYPNAMISLLTREKRRVDAVATTGIMKPLIRATKRPIDGGDILPDIVKSGEREYIPDCSRDARCAQDAVQKAGMVSQLILPLKTKQPFGWKETGVFGTLQIVNIPEPTRRTSEDEILNRFTQLAAIALTNALLHSETRIMAENLDDRLNALVDVSMTLAQSKRLDEILNEMLNVAVKNVKADLGVIVLRDPDIDRLVFRAVAGRKWKSTQLKKGYDIAPTSTMGYVMRTGKPIVNPDVNVPGVPYYRAFRNIQSNCGVPIPIGGKIEGALVVESRKLRAFDEDECRLLEAFASLIGIIITQSRDFLIADTLSKISQVLSGTETVAGTPSKSL
ncbi:GAF domain-containing protein [Candidatus Poribacteria bacterium]|nr:GAF domain-containing protein [Candidatus Poribacteria bacterium]